MDNGTMKWISQGKTLVLTEAEWVKCPYCKQKPEPKHFQIQYCSIFLCIARNANERQKLVF